MEKQIKIAAKMYECRDTAKKFYKEGYSKVVKPFISSIEQIMTIHNCNAIEALLKISETNDYKENGIKQMLFMAGCVDIIENIHNTKDTQ